MKRAFLVLTVLAACAVAGTARADGDPASDYLLATQVFLPFDMKVPAAKQQELISIVSDSNKSGYHIRVALIGSAYDLGAVTSLWRTPRPYARFLAAEIQFIYKGRLLIVMPNGFGFNWQKHSSSKEYAVLSTIPIGAGAAGMLDAAVTAVQKLAAASHVAVVRTPGTTSRKSGSHDRVLIVITALAGLVLAALLRLALRRKRP